MKTIKIDKLIENSRKVIKDSCCENGAIKAGDSGNRLYPSTVQDYGYVWIRDGAYVCISADLLGLKELPEKFFRWCLERAENFRRTGIFVNMYHINGTLAGTLVPSVDVRVLKNTSSKYINMIHHGTQFQPDQGGSLLVAIDHHINHFRIRNTARFRQLIELTADGIAGTWKDKQFTLPCFDLWEEQCIMAKKNRYHVYSLAMCISGLRAAVKRLGEKRSWIKTEREMSAVFEEMHSNKSGTIPTIYTRGRKATDSDIRKEDFRPDTSLLGLVYPAGILEPDDVKVKATVERIIEKNTIDGWGLMRYPHDRYCGGVKNGYVTLKGAGPWPLLSFWMSIYFSMLGERKTAEKYFMRPLKKTGEYFPEQIHRSKDRQSIYPLVWSHSMFITAAKMLGCF